MAYNSQCDKPLSNEQNQKYQDVVNKLTDFVNTPTPTNATDYTQVCETLLNGTQITAIFGSLIVFPESFKTISRAIIKLFSSDIGAQLIRNDDVLKWIISGLKQSNTEYEELNILSISIIRSALKNDKDIEFWITNDKSTLFLWSLSLISSPFESSFQILEQIIIEHGSNRLLLQTLFTKNVIQLLLNIKADINKTDKGTMRFRAHAIWIDALNTFYTHKTDTNTDNADNDIEMKQNDDIIDLYIDNGLFQDLLQLLQSDDVLIQINVLPLLSTLSNFERGLELLLTQNIVNILLNLLKTDDAILFGKEIYKVLVQMISNTKKIYIENEDDKAIKWLNNDMLFEIIKCGFSSYDVAVQESCCLFIGLFCSFPHILKKMIVLKESGYSVVNKLCEFVNNLKMNPSAENKILATAAVHGLCEIFGVKSNDDDIYELQYGLLNALDGMERLYGLLKHPDDEMRFSVFRLINNICKQEWGVALVNDCGGMFEYLTDRNEPDIMLGCQWKYTVLESLFKNKNTNNVLNETHQEQLKKYIAEGVVFQTKDKNKNKQETVVQLGWEQY